MTGNRKRLGEEVGDVAETADEHDTKVSLADPVPDPMQAHVGGLGHPLRHRADGYRWFCSLAVTCSKKIKGWDAQTGYLQTV
jgi:hypothetical protein